MHFDTPNVMPDLKKLSKCDGWTLKNSIAQIPLNGELKRANVRIKHKSGDFRNFRIVKNYDSYRYLGTFVVLYTLQQLTYLLRNKFSSTG